jgi:hypothetical protein
MVLKVCHVLTFAIYPVQASLCVVCFLVVYNHMHVISPVDVSTTEWQTYSYYS